MLLASTAAGTITNQTADAVLTTCLNPPFVSLYLFPRPTWFHSHGKKKLAGSVSGSLWVWLVIPFECYTFLISFSTLWVSIVWIPPIKVADRKMIRWMDLSSFGFVVISEWLNTENQISLSFSRTANSTTRTRAPQLRILQKIEEFNIKKENADEDCDIRNSLCCLSVTVETNSHLFTFKFTIISLLLHDRNDIPFLYLPILRIKWKRCASLIVF